MFKGIFTALITPFRYGEIDLEAFKKMIEWQIESGIHGILIGGSTGEGQSLSEEELLQIIDLAVKTSNGKVKIIANTGVISTMKTIELTKRATDLGADAALIIAPYYTKPNQEGLYQHFKTIHDLTNIPIIIYNNPSRTGVDISNEVLIKLSQLERIMGVKDCSGNALRVGKLRQKVSSEFEVIVGDDALMLPCYAQGALGLFSVVSNIVPALVVKLHHLWCNDRIKDAIELQDLFIPLNEALFSEPNPVGFKYAASQFELCLPDVRLPLVQASEANKKLIRETILDLKTKLYESN